MVQAVMSRTLLLDVGRELTRVALLEGGRAEAFDLARHEGSRLVGQLFLGVVARVVPGLQAAFIDLGLDRAGFLHSKDVRGEAFPAITAARSSGAPLPPLESQMKAGDRVLVQVVKDPLGSKGPRLRTAPTLPSRLLVLMPDAQHVGVSQRIEIPEERARLAAILRGLRGKEGPGLVARTVAQGASAAALAADRRRLLDLWARLDAAIPTALAPSCLYEDLPPALAALRDWAAPDVERIIINDDALCEVAKRYLDAVDPPLAACVEPWGRPQGLLTAFGVDAALEAARQPRVPLPGGAYLVVEETEALTAIDVNTGSFVGGKDAAETLLATNLAAADAIPALLRFRNLGGIVVIDFIDMVSPAHRAQVWDRLARGCAADPSTVRISPFSPLGLVELSRKRVRPSLRAQLEEPCGHCDGLGWRPAASLAAAEARDAVARAAAALAPGGQLQLTVGSALAAQLRRRAPALPSAIELILEESDGLEPERFALGARPSEDDEASSDA
jgi:ribonuclease G